MISRAWLGSEPNAIECGGGVAPILSPKLLTVARRARRRSNALTATHFKHYRKLQFKVTGQVKVRSKIKIGCFYVPHPGQRKMRSSSLNCSNVTTRKCQGKILYEYNLHPKHGSRSAWGHERSTKVNILKVACDTCFLGSFVWIIKKWSSYCHIKSF